MTAENSRKPRWLELTGQKSREKPGTTSHTHQGGQYHNTQAIRYIISVVRKASPRPRATLVPPNKVFLKNLHSIKWLSSNLTAS